MPKGKRGVSARSIAEAARAAEWGAGKGGSPRRGVRGGVAARPVLTRQEEVKQEGVLRALNRAIQQVPPPPVYPRHARH